MRLELCSKTGKGIGINFKVLLNLTNSSLLLAADDSRSGISYFLSLIISTRGLIKVTLEDRPSSSSASCELVFLEPIVEDSRYLITW